MYIFSFWKHKTRKREPNEKHKRNTENERTLRTSSITLHTHTHTKRRKENRKTMSRVAEILLFLTHRWTLEPCFGRLCFFFVFFVCVCVLNRSF